MRARLSIITAAGLCAVALGGCGSSSSSGNGEDSKTADQILADVATAFGQQQSIHETITKTDADGTSTGTLDAGQTAAQATVNTKGQTTTLIVVGGNAYLGQGGAFQQLAGSDAAQLQYLLPQQMGQCALKTHGGLTKGGTSTINGKNVIEIKDDGKAPGASPGSLFVSLDGPALPVRNVQNGPQTPGGDKACGATDSDTTKSGQVDFDYTKPVPQITPPPTSGGTGSGSGSSTDTGSGSSSSTDTGSATSSSTSS